MTALARFILLFSFIGTFSLHAYTEYSGTMADFMGANQNIYIQQRSLFTAYSSAFKWIRDYVDWDWQQSASTGAFTFTSGVQGSYDNYYGNCQSYGINVLHCMMKGNSYFGYHDDYPKEGSGSGYDEQSYLRRSMFAAQVAARYGRTGSHSSASLLTSDKIQGRDYVRYFEDFNEQDQDWHSTTWPDAAYAWHSSAMHDGRNITKSSNPLMGYQNGDPQSIHVMGGLVSRSGNYWETKLTTYRNTLGADRFNQIYKVINYHQYSCSNTWSQVVTDGSRYTGYAPEHPVAGLVVGAQKVLQWRNTYAPNAEVWITEFGWDTYKAADNKHSDTYAQHYPAASSGQLAQANYLMRSFALLKGVGISKAFMFMFNDPNATSTGRYMTCGVYTGGSSPSPKQSFYYLATMQKRIGNLYFDRIVEYKKGSVNCSYNYQYKNSANSLQVNMLWCTVFNADMDRGSTITGYTLRKPFMTAATQVTCLNGDVDGVSTVLTVLNPGTSAARVLVNLSETPLFVATSGLYNPVVPTGLSGTGVSASSISLSWTGGGNSSSYGIYRASTASTNLAVLVGTSTNTSYVDTQLTGSTTYYYWVRGFSGTGASALSASANATTPGYTSAPVIPVLFRVVSASTNSISLAWEYSSNSTGYELQRSITESFENPVTIVISTGATLSYQDEGLSPGNIYYYRLRAINPFAASLYAGPLSVNTLSVVNKIKKFTDLQVYPNPFYPDQGRMKFSNVPKGTKLTVYTVSGELVGTYEIDPLAQDTIFWDGTTGTGANVVPGVYFFELKASSTLKRSGKIVLVR